jgi:hypothetical protein
MHCAESNYLAVQDNPDERNEHISKTTYNGKSIGSSNPVAGK